MFKTFEILNFGHCDLFEIWDLRFGILITLSWKRKNLSSVSYIKNATIEPLLWMISL